MGSGNVTMQFDANTAKAIDGFIKIKDKTEQLDRAAAKLAAKQQQHAENAARGNKRHSDALSGVVSQYISMSGAISGLTTVYTKLNQEMERAAENARGTELGMGNLAQMSGSPAELRRMVAEAQKSMTETGMTREQAGALQFNLQSAGMQDQRAKFARLHGIADPIEMMNAVATMQGAMGKGETGGVNQVMDKVFKASSATKTNASSLAMAAASAGEESKLIGTTDEQLLAALAVAARGKVDASEASTQIGALSAAASKNKKLKTGGGVMDVVSQIERMGLDEAGLYDLLGRKEAVKGYLTLSRTKGDVGALEKELIGVDQAAAAGTGDYTGNLVKSHNEVFAEQRAERIAKAKASLAEEKAIGGEALNRDAGYEFLNQRLRDNGTSDVRRWINLGGYKVLTTFGADSSSAIEMTAPGDQTAGRDFALEMAGLKLGLNDLNETLKRDRQASRTDARK